MIGGEDVELHLLFAEGEEYNVEEPGSQALDRKLHKNEIFTEQDAKQVAEDQQGECEHPIDEHLVDGVAQQKQPTYLAISDESNF